MSDYARRGDQAQWMANQSRQMRRVRTARPLRGGAPSLSWHITGGVTGGMAIGKHPVSLDPTEEGEVPEYKTIVGFDGYVVDGGDVTIAWESLDSGIFSPDIELTVNPNRVLLAEPYIIENEPDQAEWIGPTIIADPIQPTDYIVCALVFNRTPI